MAVQAPLRVEADVDGSRFVELGGTPVQVFNREEFLRERLDYKTGEHVSILGPTQIAGKTRLMFDLLGAIDTSEMSHPPVMLVAKPRDRTVAAGVAKLGWQETPDWPPRRKWWRPKPNGYAYWPPHLRGVETSANNDYLAYKFGMAVDDLFWRGDGLLVADELYHLFAVFRMQPEMNRHLTQGQGMGAGIMFGTQRPGGTQQGGLSGFVFNSPTHTFVARDPVKSNQKKLGDIGGVDNDITEDAARRLPPFWWLYIHRAGPKLCVIEKGR